jgi:hypothetical protein
MKIRSAAVSKALGQLENIFSKFPSQIISDAPNNRAQVVIGPDSLMGL